MYLSIKRKEKKERKKELQFCDTMCILSSPDYFMRHTKECNEMSVHFWNTNIIDVSY
jgi:hypothetical protein